MAKGRKGWFGNHSQNTDEMSMKVSESVDEEQVYSLEELLENAYLAYRESADAADLFNRSEFKEYVSVDSDRIKAYLTDVQYAAYLKAIGTEKAAPVENDSYIPENNPDSSDEALEILSEGLENSVQEIMNDTETEEQESEGMLAPEPDYGAAAERVMITDEPETVYEPEKEYEDEEMPQEPQETTKAKWTIDGVEVVTEEVVPAQSNSSTAKILNALRETAVGEKEEKQTDMTDNELEYIFNNKELLAKLRQSVYCAPDDPGMDDELRKMDLDELFEQLLRINGVTRKIPAIIENVHQLYLKRIEDVATEIPRERLEELLLYAIELIRKDNHMEYGDCLNAYLGTQIGMTTEELEKMNIANGRGGYERVTLCVRTNDGDDYYEIEAPYDQAEKAFRKYHMCMCVTDDAYFTDPVSFFGCFGIPVLHLDGELESKATFEENHIRI